MINLLSIRTMFVTFCLLFTALTALQYGQIEAADTFNSIAFYYADHVPVQKLSHFDIVIVDQESDLNPTATAGAKTKFFAYTSVGEEQTDRSYFKDIPKSWILGDDPEWNEKVINISVVGYPEFFVSKAITPQWERGYRGFFLDSLDSYDLLIKTATGQARQQIGLINVIKAIKTKYPEAKLIMNSGFEILPQVHDLIFAIACESLLQGWSQKNKSYKPVPPNIREEFIAEVNDVKKFYKMPIIAIEYCAPADKICASTTVAKIRSQGIIPYVGDGTLTTIGTSE